MSEGTGREAGLIAVRTKLEECNGGHRISTIVQMGGGQGCLEDHGRGGNAAQWCGKASLITGGCSIKFHWMHGGVFVIARGMSKGLEGVSPMGSTSQDKNWSSEY